MKVFISWSGEKSRTVASKLRDWLPDVIQYVEPWMSKADIGAGARWGSELDNALENTKFGIICLTMSNPNAPWILFEAGALAKTIEKTFVCPYLIDLKPGDIPEGPLTRFQTKNADREGTLEILQTINGVAEKGALTEERLSRAFERSWPELENTLQNLPEEEGAPVHRASGDEMLNEILVTVRELSRRVSEGLFVEGTKMEYLTGGESKLEKAITAYNRFMAENQLEPGSKALIPEWHGVSLFEGLRDRAEVGTSPPPMKNAGGDECDKGGIEPDDEAKA